MDGLVLQTEHLDGTGSESEPAGREARPDPERWNRSSPSSLRSAATWPETAASDTPSSLAARRELPCRAIAANVRSCVGVMATGSRCRAHAEQLNHLLKSRLTEAVTSVDCVSWGNDAERSASTHEGVTMQVPAPFEYERATSVDHAIALMERLGSEARVVAGGHSLLPMMKLRLATPEYLIDINDLSAELEYIRIENGEVRIGALTRHRQLLESDELAAVLPIFRDAEKVIADPVVRNRGTLGGSLCQADPVRGPVGGLRRGRRVVRDPQRRVTASCRCTTSTAARTRPPSPTARCSPRSASRSARTRRAPTTRSSDEPATGPSPRPVRP